MTISTLFRYLVGQRQAILDIARSPAATWIGLLFVLSAGFAREYDGEYLLGEPWHLLLPLGASLVTSFLLFVLLDTVAEEYDTGFLKGYLQFLRVYWMTAPLAWLYAIPVERFLTPFDATRANIYLLGLVALWRVVLITRVISVLFQARFLNAFFVVMLFADTFALFLLYSTPAPVISIMGGIRLTQSEQFIRNVRLNIGTAGIFTWLLWGAGTLNAAWGKKASWNLAPELSEPNTTTARSLWMLAIASLVLWIPVLPVTQSEQRLRYQVERDLKNGNLSRAVQTMSSHDRSDFPPLWDPPPRVGYGEETPHIVDVMHAVLDNETDSWVYRTYLQKFRNHMGRGIGKEYFWERVDNGQFDQYLSLLERLPEGMQIVAEHRRALRLQINQYSDRSESQKERVHALLKRAEELEEKDATGITASSKEEEERPDLGKPLLLR